MFLLTTLVEGAMAGALFLPEIHDSSLGSELSAYFKERVASFLGLAYRGRFGRILSGILLFRSFDLSFRCSVLFESVAGA